jgi:hypothetical protein
MLMVKKNYKIILYALGGLGLLYVLIWIFTFKPELPLEYKHALDSLNRANTELIAKQKEIDEVIGKQQLELHGLDDKIGDVKEKTTIVREYYHEVSNKVTQYTPTQIDSFFKARYDY